MAFVKQGAFWIMDVDQMQEDLANATVQAPVNAKLTPFVHKHQPKGKAKPRKSERYSEPVSQKAKGIVALGDILPVPMSVVITQKDTAFDCITLCTDLKQRTAPEKWFVRPCPENPNHGGDVAGMQSMAVTPDELVTTVIQAHGRIMKSGEKADLLVMPYLKAAVSAVVAPGMYAVWGLGHNGVTAGTSKTVVIPMSPHDYTITNISNAVGMAPTEFELEFVSRPEADYDDCAAMQTEGLKKMVTWPVQVRRSGSHVKPAAKPNENAMPGIAPGGSMKIKKIVHVHNLLTLAEIEHMTDFANVLVVQHKGSMLSHCSAHCRTKKIAMMIVPDASEKEYFSIVGQTITEIAPGWVVIHDEAEQVQASSYHPEAYAKEFIDGWKHRYGKYDVRLSVFFHDFTGSPLNSPETVAVLAGRYVKWLVHSAMALCVGETRHCNVVKMPGFTTDKVWDAIGHTISDHAMHTKVHRDVVYEPLFRADIGNDHMLAILEAVSAVYALPWGGAFGGAKWKNGADLAAKIIKSIMAGDIAAAIETANLLESAMHNGGRLFNKVSRFIDIMDSGTAPFDINDLLNNTVTHAEIAACALIPPEYPELYVISDAAFEKWDAVKKYCEALLAGTYKPAPPKEPEYVPLTPLEFKKIFDHKANKKQKPDPQIVHTPEANILMAIASGSLNTTPLVESVKERLAWARLFFVMNGVVPTMENIEAIEGLIKKMKGEGDESGNTSG